MNDTYTRPKWQLDCEVFALRDHEQSQLFVEKPDDGRFIAVMARSVEMPPGERSKVRAMDDAPVEQAAILAAEWSHQNQSWHWLQISPPSKEHIGDLLFDSECEKDRWYYLVVIDLKNI